MKRRSLPVLSLALLLGATFTRAATPTIAIDASSPTGKVSPLLYGLMTEEINHAYDGGLYAELVQNRAFLDDAASPVHWSPVHAEGGAATIAGRAPATTSGTLVLTCATAASAPAVAARAAATTAARRNDMVTFDISPCSPA